MEISIKMDALLLFECEDTKVYVKISNDKPVSQPASSDSRSQIMRGNLLSL